MTNKEFIESIRLEGEEWRDVVGWEGYYMVSSFGRIATMYREYIRTDGAHCHTAQRMLSGNIQKFGRFVRYKIFTFRLDNKRYHLSAHQMVAMAFIPNPNGYKVVDHIDTNGLNNNVSNLHWCTQAMNMCNPASRAKQSAARKGVPNLKNSKGVIQIRNNSIVRIYRSMSEAENSGFSHSAICRVCRGQQPEHLGYKWMYLSDYEKLQDSMSKNSNP